jgi:Cys-tRNA(Pro)/Cys-tRNA(Cys) deacylase
VGDRDGTESYGPAVARTPAIAAVERAGIGYTLHEYELDRRADSFGLEAAEKLGLDPARVFKTLVVSVDDVLAFALVPAHAQLDLHALGKRARLADKHQAERVTGSVAGGISPIAARRALPTYLDASALELDTIVVSAGRRGLQLELAPQDLVRLTRAQVTSIAALR